MTDVKMRGPEQWDMAIEWMEPDALVPNPENPNEQDDKTFNALVETITTEGWTQPVQAVWDGARDAYEIVAGEHRWRAAKVLECKVPVLVLPHEDFDRDRRDWNVVKDNMLRGGLNPEKFTRLYQRMAEKYDAEVLKTLMGFTSQDAFRKVYREVAQGLPAELQAALRDAKDEIKTIDDLSSVLNRLFRDHGETLDSNMMVFSWGGKEILWIRADKTLFEAARAIAETAAETEGDDATQAFTRVLTG